MSSAGPQSKSDSGHNEGPSAYELASTGNMNGGIDSEASPLLDQDGRVDRRAEGSSTTAVIDTPSSQRHLAYLCFLVLGVGRGQTWAPRNTRLDRQLIAG